MQHSGQKQARGNQACPLGHLKRREKTSYGQAGFLKKGESKKGVREKAKLTKRFYVLVRMA